MPSLFSIPTSKDPIVGPVIALRSQLAQDHAATGRAQQTYDRLALELVDGAATQKDADKAYDVLTAAVQRQDRTAGTLRAAEVRTEAQRLRAVRDVLDTKLNRCVALASKRAQAADDVEAATKHLAQKIDAQRQLEVALAVELPGNFSTARRDGLYLENNDLKSSFFHETERVQLWPGPLPQFDHAPYAVKYHQSVDVMRARRLEVLEGLKA